uniref:Glycoprotein n=1 Tax=Ictalurid rhabdovirus TaxID=2137754 RepID=A0A2R4SU14_9RHAB|nr:glycoprotein [Ictalurid rhabdovirus]AVZ61193.1 glycoprotein [Ictalurid rhabdovirus]
MSIYYALFVVSLAAGCWSIPVFVPQDQTIAWQPVVRPFNYQCPIHGSLPDTSGLKSTKLTFRSPSVFSPGTVSGWICHAAEWKTTCDYRWYGPQYITHSIHSIRPTIEECKRSIQQLESGTDEDLGFPPQSCGWASVTTVSNKNYKVVVHPVHLEPYQGKWVDHEFVGGECDAPVCEMRGNHSIWLTNHVLKEECNQHIKETTGIMYGNVLRGDNLYVNNFIIDEHHRVYKFKGACRMKFCGVDGIKFLRGDWVEKQGELARLHDDVPDCSEGTVISGHKPGVDLVDTVFNLENILEFTLCEGTKAKVNRQEALTSVDLSYLAPRVGGLGSIFRVRNGTLEKGSTIYMKIDVEGPIVPELEGFDPRTNQSRVFWDDWELDGTTYQGFNGIYKGQDQMIHIPLNMIESGLVDEELQRSFQADTIPHPHFSDDSISDDGIFFDNTGESGNPVDAVVEWVSGWGTSLKFFGTTLIALVLLFIVVRVVITIIYCLKKPKKLSVESHEMRSFV